MYVANERINERPITKRYGLDISAECENPRGDAEDDPALLDVMLQLPRKSAVREKLVRGEYACRKYYDHRWPVLSDRRQVDGRT